jgi:C1A family cysteine protease
MLGLRVDPTDQEALVLASRAASSAGEALLPKAVDWRNRDGRNWVTPIRSQGPCGSCVAFGVVAAMESAVRISLNDPDLDIDLSEADLFFCAGGKCVGGMVLRTALDYARTTGVGLESDFPYSPTDTACKAMKPAYRIDAWHALASRAQRKQAIAEDGAIVGAMQIYEDFRYYTAGIYERTSDKLVGAHAVCIVGYDDREGCWIAKNSWSTMFGEAGYFRIKYGECCIDDAFASYGMNVSKVV